MSEPLNVIALISGGKDSLFSLLHCIAHGHKIVALANLYPSQSTQSSNENSVSSGSQSRDQPTDGEDEVPDLNSFMYQTVGYSIIPLYASALQIPLYRRSIVGTSIQQSQHYDTSSSTDPDQQIDETEDLALLLQQVISAHPEANAVSTGAILSTYQRTRVESIALRLHLTPIGYLWQYPVLPPSTTVAAKSDSLTALLDDMATAGLEACIIKIASAGIPEKCLFSKVTDISTRTQLVRGLTPFFQHDELGLRGAVLGEGGEYETLALSGPPSVWKGGRIEIDESSSKSFVDAGVTYMKLGRSRLVPHHFDVKEQEAVTVENGVTSLVPLPGLFDPQFVRVKKALEMSKLSEERPTHSSSDSSPSVSPLPQSNSPVSVTVAIESSTITINNITESSITSYLHLHQRLKHEFGHNFNTIDATPSPSEPSSSTSHAGTQIQSIVDLLPSLLQSIAPSLDIATSPTAVSSSLSVRNITSATVLLSSMADFSTVNPVYSKIWPLGLPSPPARVTISTDLPLGTLVRISLVLHLGSSSSRRGLHVQGRSYWAPANIGPYSQAVAVPSTSRNTTSIYQEDDEDCLAHLETVNLAGQIPLVPSSMSLHQGSFLDSCILSLQHLWRVGQERGVDIWPWGIAYITTDERTNSYVGAADRVWKEVHMAPTGSSSTSDNSDDEEEGNDEDTVDIWHLRHNRAVYHGFGTAALPMTVGKHLHLLPNHDIFNVRTDRKSIDKNLKHIPPIIAVEVSALPKNACIEWWSTGIAGIAKTTTFQKKTHATWTTKLIEQGRDSNGDSSKFRGSMSCLTIHPDTNNPRITINFVTYLISSAEHTKTNEASTQRGELPVTPSQILAQLNGTTSEHTGSDEIQLVHGTAFVSSSLDASSNENAETPVLSGLNSLAASMTTIPCRGLWGKAAATHEGALPMSADEGIDDPDLGDGRLLAAFVMRIDLVRSHGIDDHARVM